MGMGSDVVLSLYTQIYVNRSVAYGDFMLISLRCLDMLIHKFTSSQPEPIDCPVQEKTRAKHAIHLIKTWRYINYQEGP